MLFLKNTLEYTQYGTIIIKIKNNIFSKPEDLEIVFGYKSGKNIVVCGMIGREKYYLKIRKFRAIYRIFETFLNTKIFNFLFNYNFIFPMNGQFAFSIGKDYIYYIKDYITNERIYIHEKTKEAVKDSINSEIENDKLKKKLIGLLNSINE